MMKTVILLLTFLSTTALAQVRLPTNETGQVQYQETTRVPNATQTARQLLTQVRAWADKHYPDQNEVEQQLDQEHTILFIRTFYPIDKQNVRYTLTVETKYGRYRATITDLVLEGDGLTQAQPIRAVSTTTDELSHVSADTVKRETLVQIASDQATLYQEIDKACRGTLASLKVAMTEPIK